MLTFGAAQDLSTPATWHVDAVNHDSEGEVYSATFTGHFAEERAREYAAWKNAGNGIDLAKLHPPYQDPRPRHCPACGGAKEAGGLPCPTCAGTGVVDGAPVTSRP